jgi:hypothetical protein
MCVYPRNHRIMMIHYFCMPKSMSTEFHVKIYFDSCKLTLSCKMIFFSGALIFFFFLYNFSINASIFFFFYLSLLSLSLSLSSFFFIIKICINYLVYPLKFSIVLENMYQLKILSLLVDSTYGIVIGLLPLSPIE